MIRVGSGSWMVPLADLSLILFIVTGGALTAELEPVSYTWISIKNLFRYLVLMFFPLQTSPLLEESPFWVWWVLPWWCCWSRCARRFLPIRYSTRSSSASS